MIVKRARHWALPALFAILIPLIVAVIVSGVYLQRGRVRQVAELRQEMSQSLVLAQEAGADADAARQHYLRLLELATEAEELRPGDPGVSEMRRQAAIALDQLDGVTRLTAVPFYTFGRSADLTAVSLREDFNGGIYTLMGPMALSMLRRQTNHSVRSYQKNRRRLDSLGRP